ncbi:MAG: hypothetical protein FWF50_05800 [Defluviitaleaceae bacterium]|nr:hypothetical protein [Defluviitaleaceae bacterium]
MDFEFSKQAIKDLMKLDKNTFELILSLYPDDIATKDDIIQHEISMEEYRKGETINITNIDW